MDTSVRCHVRRAILAHVSNLGHGDVFVKCIVADDSLLSSRPTGGESLPPHADGPALAALAEGATSGGAAAVGDAELPACCKTVSSA